jgi:hypothetical protein
MLVTADRAAEQALATRLDLVEQPDDGQEGNVLGPTGQQEAAAAATGRGQDPRLRQAVVASSRGSCAGMRSDAAISSARAGPSSA